MARLADYFIVVGYDHEKPGKGVGRRRPRASPPPGRCPVGSAGPGIGPGVGEGQAESRRSGRSASGLLGWAEPGGGRGGRHDGNGREDAASAQPRAHPLGRPEASWGLATLPLEAARYPGQSPGIGPRTARLGG